MACMTDFWEILMAWPITGNIISGIRITPMRIFGSLTSSRTSLTTRLLRLPKSGRLHEDLLQILSAVFTLQLVGPAAGDDLALVDQSHSVA